MNSADVSPQLVQLVVRIDEQQLYGFDDTHQCICSYPVSTAAKGAGEQKGSFQTPRGKHRIRAKIGANQPENTVFVGRRPTGEIFDEQLDQQYPKRDWILTRILWLCGEEIGINRLGNVDTMQRYVYIHGTPARVDMHTPGSHGCIRMRNSDLIELFERVQVGTKVIITETALNNS